MIQELVTRLNGVIGRVDGVVYYLQLTRLL